MLKMVLLLAIISILAETSWGQNSATSFSLERVARIRGYSGGTPLPLDIFDPSIYSPKSARFSADGKKLYINSLEGGQTAVYAWPSLKKIKNIDHRFGPAEAHLFFGETTLFNYPYYTNPTHKNVNIFMGKPVESELSHHGRWLWIPYYRRDFDKSGQSPSALAIVDTQTDEIVRVMPTGPIPKYVVVSPNDNTVAVIHWGDNTVAVIDTSSGDPLKFHYVSHLVVETQLSQKNLGGTDRDSTCGFCLRGAVFTADSNYLLVARMGQGGVAGFHVPTRTYLGSVMNVASTPRHLALTSDFQTLYASSNVSGTVSRIGVEELLQALLGAKGQRVSGPPWAQVKVGAGARTLAVTADGEYIFTAVNNSSELVVVHGPTLQVIARIKVDPFAVGLTLSPDESVAVVTSQGRSGVGGNAVNIITIRRDPPGPTSTGLN